MTAVTWHQQSTTIVHHKWVCYINQGVHHHWYLIVKDHRGKEMLPQGTLPWSAWDQSFDGSHKQLCLQQPPLFFPQETPAYTLLIEYVKYQRTWRTVPRHKTDLACLTSVSYIITLLTSNTGSLQTAVPKQQEHILKIHTFSVSC